MHNPLEKIVEALLWRSRWMVVLAVFGSIFAAMVLMIMGAADIAMVIKNSCLLIVGDGASEHFQEITVSKIIRAVDSFLIGTVMLIFGLGLYELFICKIHIAQSEANASNVLVVQNLDQLKEKIGKVIIMVLVVTFFKHALDMKYDTVLEMVWLAVGTLLCSASLFLLGHRNVKSG